MLRHPHLRAFPDHLDVPGPAVHHQHPHRLGHPVRDLPLLLRRTPGDPRHHGHRHPEPRQYPLHDKLPSLHTC
ncbi:hypothetical protein ACFQ0T_24530 [Kitasatospora gansuensis]